MSTPQNDPVPQRVDLDHVDDIRDAVHRAVACLVQGDLVGLPSDWGTVPAVDALRTGSVRKLRELGPTSELVWPTFLLQDADALRDWAPQIATRALRLINRAWPGTTLFRFDQRLSSGVGSHLPLEVQASLAASGQVCFASPRNPFLREVLALVPGPLLIRPNQGSIRDDQIHKFSVVFESGSSKRTWPGTIVRIQDESWSIDKPGAVSAEELTVMNGTTLLFVCTGNTCRSPMAEALCKSILSRRLSCSIDELRDRGYSVSSAGVHASNGYPAAAHAVEVVKGRGGTLRDHASRRLSREMLAQADVVVAMTAEHRDLILEIDPEIADRCRLLHPDGGDVDDPYGSDRESYQQTADEIEAHLTQLLDELER